jgi:hypothetical protein
VNVVGGQEDAKNNETHSTRSSHAIEQKSRLQSRGFRLLSNDLDQHNFDDVAVWHFCPAL